MRFIDQRVEFDLRQLRRVHGVGQRKHATRCASLDDRRAVLVRQANRPACFIRSVGHANFRPGLRTQHPLTISGFVAMSARCADGVHRHQHARPRNDAALDRISQTRIQKISRADVAHRRETGLQSDTRVHAGVQGHLWNRLPQSIERSLCIVLAVHHRQVRVRINKSGQQRGVAHIDHFRIAGQIRAGSDAGDLAVGNHHDSRRNDRVALSIEHARCFQYVRLRWLFLLRKCRQWPQSAQRRQHHNPTNHCNFLR